MSFILLVRVDQPKPYAVCEDICTTVKEKSACLVSKFHSDSDEIVFSGFKLVKSEMYLRLVSGPGGGGDTDLERRYGVVWP